MNQNIRKYTAEAIGKFVLLFCGTGAIVINEQSGGTITHVGIALTFGLVVMAMIYALGDISGAHMSLTVSIAFALANRFSWKFVPLGAAAAIPVWKFLHQQPESK